MPLTQMIVAGVAVVAVLMAIAIYNSLIALLRRCDQAAGDIDVQVRLRHELVPNLVATVKGFATHESGTLEAVMKARNAAAAAHPGPHQVQAEAMLTGALGRLMAVAEAYPDLKASQNFSELQAELSDIENKIAAARRYLNSAVTEYNTTREQFPANIVGNMFQFKAREAIVMPKDARVQMETVPVVKF